MEKYNRIMFIYFREEVTHNVKNTGNEFHVCG